MSSCAKRLQKFVVHLDWVLIVVTATVIFVEMILDHVKRYLEEENVCDETCKFDKNYPRQFNNLLSCYEFD